MNGGTRLVLALATTTMLAGCGDSAVPGTAPREPLAFISGQPFEVEGGTYERHVPGPTYFATYSGGEIRVEAVSSSGATLLGTVEAVWGAPATFTEPAGSSARLTATAYSGCSFTRWVDVDSGARSTANPIYISSFASLGPYRGEFTCVV